MYADIVIDISHEQLDRPFQYHIPEKLEKDIRPGVWVRVPFGAGNVHKRGFVLNVTASAAIRPDRIKDIAGLSEDGVGTGAALISLAVWICREYGGTLIQALKTVMPVKRRIKQTESRIICRNADDTAFLDYIALARQKNWKGRLRLLECLQNQPQIPVSFAREQLKTSGDVIRVLCREGLITVSSEVNFRNTVKPAAAKGERPQLNEQQKQAAQGIIASCRRGSTKPVLLYGITGSGKTEVYMEVMQAVLEMGRQIIVLIPEISLTYQVVMNFYARFGRQVSMINSRLSDGERYDQFERARSGDIRIMIGPRSALFTPFSNLGLIIIDEEQEGAYKSETIPRYHARETAAQLARLTGAALVLGSATPSLESYSRAESGDYDLYCLTKRAVKGSCLPEVEVVDMRKELAMGNRSVFSASLREKLEACLAAKKQALLFINRRGFSRVVSCRSCGKPVGCPHCAVALTEHYGGRLICHYCGYTIPMPSRCPHCGSPYLAGFGLGTQKVELVLRQQYPGARILRMDMDTTAHKGDHERIIEAFRQHEADILVGTQMIVKGHDFPEVTLVGILAADMSLHGSDFRSGERTFQLLTQAAGRAGRGINPGNVVIQAYDPDNYSIQAAAQQDFPSFYQQEKRFRRRLSYPPCGDMCEVLVTSADEVAAGVWVRKAQQLINREICDNIYLIGPSDAPVSRIKDMWRKHLFVRTPDHELFCRAVELMGILSEEARKNKVYISVTTL